MPDYASILRRSVSALPDPTPEMREAVYQRARAALARQLTAVEPPLSSREIEAQHQELEDAVARLEAEYAPQEPAPQSFEPQEDEFAFTAPAATPTAPSPPPPPPPPPPREDFTRDVADEYEADDEDDDEEDFIDEEDRASRMPALIGLLVIVVAVIGIGALAYSQRDTVMAIFGMGSDVEEPTQTTAVTPEPVVDDSGKSDDRLTNGGGTTPEPETSENVMVVPETTDTQLPETTTALSTDQGTTGEAETSLVAQRAIYYYQGAEGQAGEANEGTASWANITKDGNPAIRATLQIPDRGVEATVTIYKNYDTALPASHLVEIQFNGSLSESPIQRVPALVMKQTEQARGQPLAGAAVPVTSELFWIALSDDEEQVSRNIQLLREGSWFDVPILYDDQTRALLTFEKGIPGDRVFETVMATWTP